MPETASALLEALAKRHALESFTLESTPAVFEGRDGKKTTGTAVVQVSRSSVAIRFSVEGLSVPKAGYGESNGKVSALDGSWSAPNVNDAGKASDGDHLFGTMAMVTGRASAEKAAVTRLVIAGAAWSGSGAIGGRPVIVRPLSKDAVNHHDRRLSITIEGDLDPTETENLGRTCGFVSGIEVEILRMESYAADGSLIRTKHHRGYRLVGRGPHSPFTGVPDEHRMRAFIALAAAFPRLLQQGIPIDMIVDQISAHNQVAQIHVAAPLLLLATATAAYHRKHGDQVDGGAASRREELSLLNRDLQLGLSEANIDRFEKLRVELLDTGFFHKPGYETGRPQQDIKFIRDVSHAVVFRLCGYSGPFYSADRYEISDFKSAS